MKIKVYTLLGSLFLTACSFDNRSGQFAFDLNTANTAQRGVANADIAGVYQTVPMPGGQRYEMMQITALGKQRYRIHIHTPHVAQGCQFNAEATLNNNQLLIPLSGKNQQAHATMLIKFGSEQAIVDSTHPQTYNSLKCADGGSLVGRYLKVR